MLTVISPAKTLDYESPVPIGTSTRPVFLEDSQILVEQLKSMSAARLAKLMNISDKLGKLNKSRYQTWHIPFEKPEARQALLAFKGDVYRGLNAATFSGDDFKFAQQHLRILSGLYGVLRPLDLMLPYRLEMGTRLKNERGNNLYDFWGDQITDNLNKQLKKIGSGTLINLASVEYFKSIKTDKLNADIVAPVFLDEKNGAFKVISFYAKKARGTMSAWLIKSEVEDVKKLRRFKGDGYRYSADHSEPGKPAFVREEQK